jgi:hypothetical protein
MYPSRAVAGRAPIWISLALALVAIARPASAHDPFELTTTGRVRAGSLEILVTMTRSAALSLVAGDDSGGGSFTPERFRELEPGLKAGAPNLYRISSRGRALRPRAVAVALSPENEVEFRLSYERPDAGSLRLDALHLTARPLDGYVNAITLTNDVPNALLGVKVLTASDPVLDALVPERPEGPAPARSWLDAFRSFLVLGLLFLVVGAYWLIKRT